MENYKIASEIFNIKKWNQHFTKLRQSAVEFLEFTVKIKLRLKNY